jgi:FtsH-binding integral membrane protein
VTAVILLPARRNSRQPLRETNCVSAKLSVYLSIYNVFVSLLQLIMDFTGQRD